MLKHSAVTLNAIISISANLGLVPRLKYCHFHLIPLQEYLYQPDNFIEICFDVVHVELVSFVTHIDNCTASF